MLDQPSRRMMLGTTAALAASTFEISSPRANAAEHSVQPVSTAAATTAKPAISFGFCLNTSTIRGANLTIIESLEVAAKAGYTAVEPWIGDINDYQKKGGSLKDLAKRVADLGLSVEDAIGFDEWIVDDEARRTRGLESMKAHMGMLAEIGGKRLAAPPIGANGKNDPLIDLRVIAERYRKVLELGDAAGVQPLLELWGPSRNLHRLSEVAYVAIEADHPRASLLLDLYHLHKGGSDFSGLSIVNPGNLRVIHTNDWPDLPVDQLADDNRIFPGDGVAPWDQILRLLADGGFHGVLSLELFNRDYWKQSPLKVAKIGLEKMQLVVQKHLGGLSTNAHE